jgi:predicted DNA-binding transcriptional regulator YafY
VEQENRILSIFVRGIRGENLSIKKLVGEYGMSHKSIARDIAKIKNFLSEYKDLVGGARLTYNRKINAYQFQFDEFLNSSELTALTKILIGSRVLSKMSLLSVIEKLKGMTTTNNRKLIDLLIEKEVYRYNEVRHECKDLLEYIWQLTNAINDKKEITVQYYKLNREHVTRRLRPAALIFSEYYFYLIAYKCDDETLNPHFYRADRIISITEHHESFSLDKAYDFDEGELREKIHFMFSGVTRKITFECELQSLQAILDRIPTAKIMSRKHGKATVEAEVYGEGIKMFLLSQGDWVKVLAPSDFVDEMREKVQSMARLYE